MNGRAGNEPAVSGRDTIRGFGILLELGRVSNLPTVWSNVFAGWLLAGGLTRIALGEVAHDGWGGLVWKLIGLSLLYTGGMFLNDAWDASWDRVHRPERPVPSGRIQRRSVWLWAAALILAGLVALWAAEPRLMALGGTLVLMIVLYTACHKRTSLSVFPMSACRMLAYWIGGASAVAAHDWGWAMNGNIALPGGLPAAAGAVSALYILGLTSVARRESHSRRAKGRGILELFMVCGTLATFLSLAVNGPGLAVLGWGTILFWWGATTFWGAFKGTLSVSGVVSRLLAGIPLLDGLLAGSFAGAWGAIFLACFLLALAGQRRIAAT